MKGGAEFVYVGAVAADGLMEGLAGDAELLGPIGDVGGELGVHDLGVVRSLGGSVFVLGVGGVFFGSLLVFVFGIVMRQKILFRRLDGVVR